MDKLINKKLEWEENWQAKAGAWFAGERVVMHGENILQAMQGRSWMDMLLLAIRGKKPDPAQARLLDEVLVFSGCIPDPRLWNNRIAALAGTARSSSPLVIAAATAVSHAVIYGFRPGLGALQMLREISARVASGEQLQDLIKERLQARKHSNRGSAAKGKKREIDLFPGYGRPGNKGDERNPSFIAVLERHNAHEGPSIKLAYAIQDTLQALGYKLNLNMAGLIAAVCLDQNLGDQEFLHYVTVCFFPGLIACFDDAATNPEGSFFPMRCEQIEYQGEPARQWSIVD